jgi:hypothetical protein
MLLGKTLVVAETLVEQMLGEVEADFRRPQPFQHLRGDGDAGADDAFHHHRGRADIGRRDLQPAVGGEGGFQFFGRQVAAITADAREADF